MGSNKDTSDDVSARLNRALHSIDAHLHRYRSELSSMEGITLDLASHYATICDGDTANKVSQDFSQVLSQIQATSTFAKELEKKIQNILALVNSPSHATGWTLSPRLLTLASCSIAYRPAAINYSSKMGGLCIKSSALLKMRLE